MVGGHSFKHYQLIGYVDGTVQYVGSRQVTERSAVNQYLPLKGQNGT